MLQNWSEPVQVAAIGPRSGAPNGLARLVQRLGQLFRSADMHTQPRAQLAQQLDDLQALVPVILGSGSMETQCLHVVERAAELLHRAGSMDRDYVTDRLAWILAKLPPGQGKVQPYAVESLPRYDAFAARRLRALAPVARAIA
jgi:hypothetical protein